jgi:group I intron endonuclease
MDENISCIYCYENILDGKKYIGQAVNLRIRKGVHKRNLEKGIDCPCFQRAWDKYGEENFKFYILIQCDISKDPELLNKLEVFYIKYLHSHASEWGYNVSWGGRSSRTGMKHTEETKKKMSKTAKEHLNNWHMGKKRSEESKKRMSEAQRGRKHSEKQNKSNADAKQGVKRSYTNSSRKNTSKYIGVSYDNYAKRYKCQIACKKIDYHIGNFQYEIEAALAYNEAALELFGSTAKLNNISQEEIEWLWNQE